MKRLSVLFAIFALMLSFSAFVGCGDDAENALNDLGDLTEADENEPCGRYCIKCSDCDAEEGGYLKMALDYTCAVDELGSACQLACEQGSGLADLSNIEGKVESAEAAAGMEITDENYSCSEFALTVLTGETDSVCLRFCSKCVECSGEVGAGSVSDWCAKEGGVPCIEACKNTPYVEEYATTFEDLLIDNSDYDNLRPVPCTDYEDIYENADLPDAPSF